MDPPAAGGTPVTALPHPQAAQQLARRAAQWHLLGLLLSCPSERWRERVARLYDETGSAELSAAARQALAEASEELYHSLTGPGGPIPVREAASDAVLEPGSLLAELLSCYEAFGYQPPWEEPPDHVAVETDFMGYLSLKQAYALATGQPEQARLAEEAAAEFSRHHLARLAHAMNATLVPGAPAYLLLVVAELVRRTR
ncbi:MAG: molecular chaperone TorD family protein [Bryobacteraceae bacterium]